MKILVIEDEAHLLQNILEFLEKENYRVESAMDYDTALEKVMLYEYDCIVLDIMIPNGTGLQLLAQLKKEGKKGNVIIISAKDSLDDKLVGLDLGADDYLTKPFHLAELNARIKAVLRRKLLGGSENLSLGNLSLDLGERLCWVNTLPLALNRKEFDVLSYLLMNKNRLLTKSALAEHIWGDHTDQADSLDFVYYQIKNLRKKLQDAGADLEIESIYGVGYKLLSK